MTTVDEAGRPAGAPDSGQSEGSLWTNPDLRRLVGFLLAGVMLAIMSGPEGRLGQPAYAVSQSLHPKHLLICLAIGVAAWGLATLYLHNRRSVQRSWRPVRESASAFWDRRAVRLGLSAVVLAFFIALPYLVSDLWQGVLVEQIGVYALLAIGLNVVVGFAGLLDLGYIAFYAIGAYTTAYFSGKLPVAPPFTINPFFIIPLAVMAAMIAGLILGAPTLRLRGDYLAIVTLGFGEIVTILAVNLDSVTNGARGAFGIPSFSLGSYDFGIANRPYYYLLLVFTVLILFLFSLLENSRVGRAWTAVREDEVAAQAVGIPTVKYKLMAFAIGASTSGFAGVLYASKIGFINPSSFAVSASILVLVLVIFGGMGSLPGSIAGAVVLQGIFAHIRKNNGVDFLFIHVNIDPADIFIYVGAVLIIMMIFRPQGIIPSRRRAREIGLAEHGIGGADAMGAPPGSPM